MRSLSAAFHDVNHQRAAVGACFGSLSKSHVSLPTKASRRGNSHLLPSWISSMDYGFAISEVFVFPTRLAGDNAEACGQLRRLARDEYPPHQRDLASVAALTGGGTLRALPCRHHRYPLSAQSSLMLSRALHPSCPTPSSPLPRYGPVAARSFDEWKCEEPGRSTSAPFPFPFTGFADHLLSMKHPETSAANAMPLSTAIQYREIQYLEPR